MRVLVTGAAGFIGSALLESLGRKGIEAVGVDNFSTYYSPAYKLARLKHLGFPFDSFPADNSHSSTLNSKLTLSSQFSTLSFVRLDVCDRSAMGALFVRERFTHVVHLAAQPGVRRSLTHPYDYLRNNIEGFLTLLETVREYPVEHLVYASSSSVYGPWGRPDMAPMLFGRAIMEERAIRVFNHGEMKRDFTYIDDIVGGIEKVLFGGWKQEGPHVYNIGHGSPVDLMEFIGLLEKYLGREAHKEMLGMQPGDVPLTYADTSALAADYGYRADTPLEEGLRAFADWLKDYRKDG